MPSTLGRFAWLIALVVGIPVAIGIYRLIWPCFIAGRFYERFPILYGLVIAVTCVLLQVGSERPPLQRVGIALGLALAAGIATPVLLGNVLGPHDLSKQKWTMAEMRTVGEFVNEIKRPLPLSPIADTPEWQAAAAGGRHVPTLDGWQGPLRVEIRGDDRFVVSCGACGQPDTTDVAAYQAGPTTDYEADIVLKNGEFIRYPQGIQR